MDILRIGFWYGAKLIRDENHNIGDVTIVSYISSCRLMSHLD